MTGDKKTWSSFLIEFISEERFRMETTSLTS